MFYLLNFYLLRTRSWLSECSSFRHLWNVILWPNILWISAFSLECLIPFVCLNVSNWIEQSDFSVTVKSESAVWNFSPHFSSIFIRSNWIVFCHFDRTLITFKCAQFNIQVRSASAEEVSSLIWRSITLSEHRVQINLQSDAYFMQFSSYFCVHHMDQRNNDNDSFLDCHQVDHSKLHAEESHFQLLRAVCHNAKQPEQLVHIEF